MKIALLLVCLAGSWFVTGCTGILALARSPHRVVYALLFVLCVAASCWVTQRVVEYVRLEDQGFTYTGNCG